MKLSTKAALGAVAAVCLVFATAVPAQAGQIRYGSANCGSPAAASSAATTTNSTVHYHDNGPQWSTSSYGSGYHKWVWLTGTVSMNISTVGVFSGSASFGCSL